jgi:hypothetical protein
MKLRRVQKSRSVRQSHQNSNLITRGGIRAQSFSMFEQAMVGRAFVFHSLSANVLVEQNYIDLLCF